MRKTCHSLPPATSAAPRDAPWSSLIPEDQWAVFTQGTNAIAAAGVPGLLGGAMALATYTHHWRNTKDIDLIILPDRREPAIAALVAAGFDDYFTTEAYDRSWIFRGFRDGVLYDLIWELPNHRVRIDEAWFARATPIRLRDGIYAAVPAEELIRVKLYVMQRERCDWVDVLNILAGTADQLDWAWLVRRMERDLPLLHAALALFNWMCPGRAGAIPAWLRHELALPALAAEDADATERHRVRLFDSRPWFAAHQPTEHPLPR